MQAGHEQDGNQAMRRHVTGSLAAVLLMAVLTAAMLPLRSHLSIASTALILTVPVVVGVVLGGFLSGVLSVVVGFLVYDFFFIPPYLTLWVGATENWIALGVYVVVMLPIARVVASMNSARANANRRGMEIRELFQISGMLVEDRPLDELLGMIVNTLLDIFDARQVALLLPVGERLEIVASAGVPLTRVDQDRLPSRPHELTRLDAYGSRRPGEPLALALVASGRPIGMLVTSGTRVDRYEREPLLLFANQIALAVERAQLREQALRAELIEEVERLARMLVTAVSHDLRAPLASIKASSSTLADADLELSTQEVRSLAALVDGQVDRLAVLVTNLLDMSRVQAGVLHPRRTVISPVDLVESVLNDISPAVRTRVSPIEFCADLPAVNVDAVLMSRVLTNLLDNAARHGPKGTGITIGASIADRTITLSVTDHGPGIGNDRRSEIFGLFPRRDGDSGTGLGLSIAKAFVEAHGERIWVEEATDAGARFCFTLPVIATTPREVGCPAS